MWAMAVVTCGAMYKQSQFAADRPAGLAAGVAGAAAEDNCAKQSQFLPGHQER
jgi:hypothetical protein